VLSQLEQVGVAAGAATGDGDGDGDGKDASRLLTVMGAALGA